MSESFVFFKDSDCNLNYNSRQYISIGRANRLLNEKGDIVYHRRSHRSWDYDKDQHGGHVRGGQHQDREALIIGERPIEKEPECDHATTRFNVRITDMFNPGNLDSWEKMTLENDFCPKCGKDLRDE